VRARDWRICMPGVALVPDCLGTDFIEILRFIDFEAL
jgi:hypothetical protein